jgi:hypothetical protein
MFNALAILKPDWCLFQFTTAGGNALFNACGSCPDYT